MLSGDSAAVFAVVYSRVLLVGVLLGFGLLALGVELFWLAFVIGIVGAMPAALVLAAYADDDAATHSNEPTAAEAALEELRARYARGEYTEAEFERRVERLLKTRSLPEARSHLDDQSDHASNEPTLRNQE